MTLARAEASLDTSGVPKPKTFTDAIRKAILEAPITRYDLAKRLDVSQGTLSDFVNRKHGIGSELLDRVAKELGLRLVVVGPGTKQKRRQ